MSQIEKSKFQFFNFEGNEVRVVLDKDKTEWFNVNDVCNALGHSNPRMALSNIKGVSKIDTPTKSGVQSMNYVNEAGLYKLIMRSNKKSAEQFQDFVFEEVLPSIRKHGMYATDITIDKMIADPDFAIDLLTTLKNERALRIEAERTKAEIGHRREATAMNTASQAVKKANKLEIELDKSKEWVSVKKMEYQFKRKFKWQELKKASIDMGYEIKKAFDPNFPNGVNTYHSDVWLEVYGVWVED